MRLIDADALEVFVKTVRQGLYLDKTLSDIPTRDSMLLNFQQYVHLQPTISAVPVVRGEWKMDTDPDDGDCRCSSCKVCIDALHKRNHGLLNALGFKLHTFYKYCPNCGAKMESEAR